MPKELAEIVQKIVVHAAVPILIVTNVNGRNMQTYMDMMKHMNYIVVNANATYL